ncbi:NTPase [Heyndrickxia sporothermodurans]|nr:NTPase [Heyndrickxia sporothermodurans]
MKIALGSTNPAKVQAVIEAFNKIDRDVSVISTQVSSEVNEQPFSDEETIKGAINRAKNAIKKENAEIGIGLEGGVTESPYGLTVCNWGALVDREKPPIIAGGARFLLPEEIAIRLRNGEELGPVMDGYVKRKNISKKEGAIGIFTNDYITREDMFLHIMTILLGQYDYQNSL